MKLTKLARRIGRLSIHPQLESTQVVDEPRPQREVVDIAPDLLRRCSLETQFPSVAFGGYIKYYRSRSATTGFPDSATFNLAVTPPPSSRKLPPPSPITPSLFLNSPTKTVQKTMQPLKTPRKARPYSFSGAFSISKQNPQLFRWKRATCVMSTPNITEHQLSPIFPQAPNSGGGRPSFEMARSQSSSGSAPLADSIPFEFRRASLDSDSSTLPPNTPYSLYSNDEAGAIKTASNNRDVPTRTWTCSRRRPPSSTSYRTAKSAFSHD